MFTVNAEAQAELEVYEVQLFHCTEKRGLPKSMAKIVSNTQAVFIQDLTSVDTISSKLCTALSAIGTVCEKDLNQDEYS